MGVGLLCSQAKSIAASVNQRFDRLLQQGRLATVCHLRAPHCGRFNTCSCGGMLAGKNLATFQRWSGHIKCCISAIRSCAYTMVAMKKCARHDGRAHGLFELMDGKVIVRVGLDIV